MDPVYSNCKSKCKINDQAWGWRAFQTMRTFILVTFIKVLPEVGSLSEGFGLWKQIFTNHTIPTSLHALLPFINNKSSAIVVCIGTIILLVVSLIQRKGSFRSWLGYKPLFLRLTAYSVMFIAIIYFGIPASGNVGGFMYEQF